MKFFLKIIIALLLFSNVSVFAQGICNVDGNVILFCNYDGGTLNINIDENIPDIRIGLCSYEPLTVNISGTYVGNVTQVLWAGYTIEGTSVSGVDAGIVDLLQFPAATIQDPDGYQFIICAYECDLDYVPGGCNTVDQASDYFLTTLNGFLRFSNFQYGVWGGTYNISSGGNCCVGTECSIDINANNDMILCEGDSLQLSASGADTYSWILGDEEVPCDAPCNEITIVAGTDATYVVTGTDTEGCFGVEEINLIVNETPDVDLVFNGGSLYVYGGSEYMWYQDGILMEEAAGGVITPEENGIYSVYATDENGCSAWSNEVEVIVDSVNESLTSPLLIHPNPSNGIFLVRGLPAGKHFFYVYNALGQCVKSEYFDSQNYVDISELNPGIYKLSLQGNDKLFPFQIIIQK